MISSSEVGGCCRVQVAWLPSDRPRGHHPSCPSLAPSRFFALQLSPSPSAHSQPPKISDPTTDAAPRISREGVRACKVVLPSTLAAALSTFRNVGRQGARNLEKFSLRARLAVRTGASVSVLGQG